MYMDTQTNLEPQNPEMDGGLPQPALPPPTPQNTNFAVPASIVIAGALIAFAVYTSPNKITPPTAVPSNNAAADVAGAVELRNVDNSDHVLGNPNAQVKVIEFSDTECPFCKRFHATMQQVMDEYGKDGRVAWVYRHLPLDSLHPKARKEAEATECVFKLGGNEKFWAYLNKIFEITPANNGLDHALLPKLAADLGIDRAAFEQCLSSGEFAEAITKSVEEATKAGAQGTPYSLVVTKSGKKLPINGALPYESVKQIIESALAEK